MEVISSKSITKTVKDTISGATGKVSDGIKTVKDKAGVAATVINEALEQAENQNQTASNKYSNESITKTVKDTISGAIGKVSDGIKTVKNKAGVAATAINGALEQAESQNQTASNNGELQITYDRFDESSSSYVDEKFRSSDSDTQQFICNISNYEDYSIPEGKSLYDASGKAIANSGDVLSFNESASSYVVKNSSGDLQNSSQYNLDDLAKSNLTEN